MDYYAYHAREVQRELVEAHLERLLGELLGEEAQARSGAVLGEAAPPEITELQSMARRLRASLQWVPLPEGRTALRRALVTTAKLDGGGRDSATPATPRPRWRLMVGAAALLLGGFGLGTDIVRDAWSPSHPLYGVRVAVEDLGVVLVPNPVGKADMLVQTTRRRIAQIEAMAAAGDARGQRRAADALGAEAGWLHEVLPTLPAADRKRVELALKNL